MPDGLATRLVEAPEQTRLDRLSEPARIEERFALDHDHVRASRRLACCERPSRHDLAEPPERRGTQAVEQIANEHGKEAVSTLVGIGIECQRHTGGHEDGQHERQPGREPYQHAGACRHGALDEKACDHEHDTDTDCDNLAGAQERQVKTGMREQLTEKAQIGKYERLAQRLVLRITDCGDKADEGQRRAGRKNGRDVTANTKSSTKTTERM